ncbi:hypothetical protein [Pontibacter chinhatensis]|uniref:SpoIIAA-like n=1 Tax=Pontibacter chinhatensis TaxID=1436961 RepID=A0A1I2Y6W7_9BACT|nr:hypothetical protein [Pontibacter chinhatensis]SFH21097.1 hypothetical protein SAMN05421739_10790 [Pontibacter chinhatensis]
MGTAESSGVSAKEVLRNDFVVVRYAEADSLLLIDWNRQIEPEERQAAFLWCIQFSVDEQVKNWLINDEEIFIITSEEREWVSHTFTRLAAEAGIRKVAVFVPEDFYSGLQTLTDFTQDAQEIYRQFGVTEHEVFTDYSMALIWLRSSTEV